MNTVRELQQAMQAQGHWRASAEASACAWYVTALQGAAAWLAALFMLPFLGWLLLSVIRVDEGIGLVVATAALAVVAAVMLRVDARQTFLTQLGSAMALAAGALAVFWAWDRQVGWVFPLLVGAVLYAAGRSFVPRVLNALTMAGALCLALQPSAAPGWRFVLGQGPLTVLAWGMLLAWIAAGSRRRPQLSVLCTPLAWAFLLSCAVIAAVDETGTLLRGLQMTAWTPARVAVAVLPVAAWLMTWAAAPAASRPSTGLGIAVVLALLVLVPAGQAAPGLAITLACLIVGFAQSRMVLLAVSVMGLLGYLGRYYYLLDVPLLQKAVWLAAAGAVLAVFAAGVAWRVRRLT